MDNYVWGAYDTYFSTLKKLGYMKQGAVNSLLVLGFYYRLIYDDYRGYISEEDYGLIMKALNCLYGTNCLIPYPDYLKMKLRLGDITELSARTKNLEDGDKELDRRILDNDVLIADNIRRIDEHGTRLDSHDSTLSNHSTRITAAEGNIAQHRTELNNHAGRIATLENTKAMQNNKLVADNIPDINIDELIQP